MSMYCGKLVFNESSLRNEVAYRQSCPRCKGAGIRTGEDGPCHLCNGWGEVWRTESGWTIALHARKGQLW